MARETICKRGGCVLQWCMGSRDITEQSGIKLNFRGDRFLRHSALFKIRLGALIQANILVIMLLFPTLGYAMAGRLAGLPGGGVSGAVFLRYHFVVGQRLTYEVIVKGTITTQLNIG